MTSCERMFQLAYYHEEKAAHGCVGIHQLRRKHSTVGSRDQGTSTESKSIQVIPEIINLSSIKDEMNCSAKRNKL